MKIIAKGKKDGKTFTVTYENGDFSDTGLKEYNRQLLDLQTRPLIVGGTMCVDPFSDLRGKIVMYDFFDKIDDIKYEGGEEPFIPSEPGAIY